MDGLGEPCSGPGECASGFCGDVTIGNGFLGVCCDQACNGPCQFCDAIDGVCRQVFVQDDPEMCQPTNDMWCDKHGDCSLEVGSACGNDTQCPFGFYCMNNSVCAKKLLPGNSCVAALNGSDCDTGICTNNICCSTPCNGLCDTCDPGGICRLDPVFSFGGCVGGLQCNAQGNCTKPKGTQCGTDVDCASGICNDVPGQVGMRVCADQRCNGLCEATDATGSCKPVLFGPDDECNAPFECDGRNRCLLQLGQGCDIGLSCASGICDDGMCCSQPCATGSHCEGGVCAANKGAGSMCDSPSDCATGLCENGICCNRECDMCATCGGSGFNLCNFQIGGTTIDCSGGRSCNGSAICIESAGTPQRVEIHNSIFGNESQPLGSVASIEKVGQSFLVTQGFTATSVGMAIGNVSSASGNYEYRLYAAGASGEPIGSFLAKTALLNAGGLPNSQPTTLAFPPSIPLLVPLALVAGQSYVLVAVNISLSGDILVDFNSLEPFAGGRAGFAAVSATYQPQSRDARFTVSGNK